MSVFPVEEGIPGLQKAIEEKRIEVEALTRLEEALALGQSADFSNGIPPVDILEELIASKESMIDALSVLIGTEDPVEESPVVPEESAPFCKVEAASEKVAYKGSSTEKEMMVPFDIREAEGIGSPNFSGSIRVADGVFEKLISESVRLSGKPYRPLVILKYIADRKFKSKGGEYGEILKFIDMMHDGNKRRDFMEEVYKSKDIMSAKTAVSDIVTVVNMMSNIKDFVVAGRIEPAFYESLLSTFREAKQSEDKALNAGKEEN